jgi:hypothetical protein
MTGGSTVPSDRPAGLGVIAILMCALTLATFLVRQPGYLARYTAYSVVSAGLTLVVVWFFWKGKNWARWLVLAGSVLALCNLAWFWSASPPQRAYLAVQALLALWMLYWLNTRAVRSFFKRRVESRAA